MPYLFRLRFVVLISLLLSACTPASEPADTTPATSTTITFAAPEVEREIYAPLIERFNADNPNVTVQFVTQPATASIGEVATLADTAAVTEGNFTGQPDAALADLSTLMDADPTFDQTDYVPAALQPDASQAIYLLPRTLAVPLMHYNADLWADQGLPPPTDDWAWSDWIRAAEDLAQKRGDQVRVYGLLDSSGLDILTYALQRQGVDLATDSPTDFRLDDPTVHAALEQVQDYLAAGTVYIPPVQPGEFPDLAALRQQITDGTIAIWPAALSPFTTDDDTTAPFPVESGVWPAAQPSPIDGYVLSQGSQTPEQAWRWLAFLSRQPVPSTPPGWASLTLPARQSLLQDDQSLADYDPETQAAIQAALDRPAPNFDTAHLLVTRQTALAQAIPAVLTGDQTIAAALRTAQASVDEALASTSADAPAPTPVVVATPAPSAPDTATTITFQFHHLTMTEEVLTVIAQRFQQEHPGIVVRLQSLPDNTPISFETLAEGADCFVGISSPTHAYWDTLLDLQPYMEPTRPLPQQSTPPSL